MPKTTSKEKIKSQGKRKTTVANNPKKKGRKIKDLASKKKSKYIEAIGRRKTATARVRIFPGIKEKTFLVNKKEINLYFTDFELQKDIFSPLEKTGLLNKFKVEILTKGGGKRGQAEAVTLGLSRALVSMDSKLREVLRSAGYLTRDPRMKERKKFGLKKARRAPQWQKR